MSKINAVHCRKLLKLLSDDDLLALNDTVTNKMIAVGSAKGEAEFHVQQSNVSSLASYG